MKCSVNAVFQIDDKRKVEKGWSNELFEELWNQTRRCYNWTFKKAYCASDDIIHCSGVANACKNDIFITSYLKINSINVRINNKNTETCVLITQLQSFADSIENDCWCRAIWLTSSKTHSIYELFTTFQAQGFGAKWPKKCSRYTFFSTWWRLILKK